MNGIIQKLLYTFLCIPLLLFVFLKQGEKLPNWQNELVDIDLENEELIVYHNAANESSTCKAQVFHNRKGLKNEINIFNPLRELNAIAKNETETIDELIEQISAWVPSLYYEQFLINPECIIILETKINTDGKAEVRFGVAMKCTPKLRLPNPISI